MAANTAADQGAFDEREEDFSVAFWAVRIRRKFPQRMRTRSGLEVDMPGKLPVTRSDQ